MFLTNCTTIILIYVPRAPIKVMFLYVVLVIISLFIYFKIFKRRVQSISNVGQKYIFITGCDSGFGRKTAIHLDCLGFNVFATCLTEEGEKSLRSNCSERLHVIRLDVTDSFQVKSAFEYVKNTMSCEEGLWSVINNAGIGYAAPLDWQTVDEIKQFADVNLWGLIDVTKTFLPLLKKSRGRLVNVSSLGGRLSLPYIGGYCLTKFAVEAFTDALRVELCPWNIKMSLIEPGFFKTNMTAKHGYFWDKLWARLPNEKKEEYGEEFFLKTKELDLKGVQDFASSKTEMVAEAITDAVMSVKPKHRYVVGWDASLLFIWLTRLPTWLVDYLVPFFIKIQLPAALQDPKQISKD